MTAAGVYVFGIVAADHPCRLAGVTGVGGPAAAVRRVAAGRTAAVVGVAPPDLRAKRRDLLAHQLLLDRLLQQGPVLPMRFGVVAADEGQLRAALRASTRRHLDALAEVAGRVEINVKVLPDEDALLRRIAAEDVEIRRLRERGGQTYLDRLRLGEAVAGVMRERSAAEANRVRRTLRPLAVRGATGPDVQGCALNASFLVADERLRRFLDRVTELDESLGSLGEVRAAGPLPPYSFTEPAGGER